MKKRKKLKEMKVLVMKGKNEENSHWTLCLDCQAGGNHKFRLVHFSLPGGKLTFKEWVYVTKERKGMERKKGWEKTKKKPQNPHTSPSRSFFLFFVRSLELLK